MVRKLASLPVGMLSQQVSMSCGRPASVAVLRRCEGISVEKQDERSLPAGRHPAAGFDSDLCVLAASFL